MGSWGKAVAGAISTAVLGACAAPAAAQLPGAGVRVQPMWDLPSPVLRAVPGCQESSDPLRPARSCRHAAGPVELACLRSQDHRGYFMDRACVAAVRHDALAAEAACAEELVAYHVVVRERSCRVTATAGGQQVAWTCEATDYGGRGEFAEGRSCTSPLHRRDCTYKSQTYDDPARDECVLSVPGTPAGSCRVTVVDVHAPDQARVDQARSGCA